MASVVLQFKLNVIHAFVIAFLKGALCTVMQWTASRLFPIMLKFLLIILFFYARWVSTYYSLTSTNYSFTATGYSKDFQT